MNHSTYRNRIVGFTGWIGGVAVYDRALSGEEIKRLSEIGRPGPLRL